MWWEGGWGLSPTIALYISILDWIAEIVVDEVKIVISGDQGKHFQSNQIL